MSNADNVSELRTTRFWLAIGLTTVSIIGIIVLGWLIIHQGDKSSPQQVLGTMLPLIGTWVGTVLAYYFSKENFEAATRSVTELAKQVSPQEKLRSLLVKDKMIPRAQMFYKTFPIDGEKIKDVLAELERAKKGDRIPVLTADKFAPTYIIHRSMLDQYVAAKARAAAGVDVSALTFADLFKERPELQELFATSFATVKPDATLADAKLAMDHTNKCEDVFVTPEGTSSGEVVGWVTDNIIQANLQA